MAYTVLARRYRSASFDQLVGQGHIAQTLQRAITSGRIAHAFLFCGTRGTGKTSVARILAKALNCLSSESPTANPCNTCSSCTGITRGDDLDYVEIDAASHTGVDNVRDVIINNSAYRPARGRFKIYLIDEVHMLSKSSFNALLKTLEEPPEHVKFILATTEPEKIPTTILSRCQRYDFKNIAVREVAAHLKWICEQEGIAAQDEALLKVARAGGGSMRDALSLLDRLLSVGEKTLTVETIDRLLGVPATEQLEGLVEAMGAGRAGEVLSRADGILSSGMSPDALIAGLIDFLHQLLLLRVCGEKSELLEVSAGERARLGALAGRFDAVVLTQDIAVLEELRRQVRSGLAGRAMMDATLVRLALADQFRSVSELMSGDVVVVGRGGGDGEEKKKFVSEPVAAAPTTAPTPVTAAPPTEAASAVPPAVVEEDDDDDLPRPGKVWDNSGPSVADLLKARTAVAPPAVAGVGAEPANIEPVDERMLPEVWQGVLEAFRKSQPSLAGMLTGSELGSVTDEHAVVRLPAGQAVLAGMLERDGRREKVSAALSSALGRTVGLKLEVAEGSAGGTAVAEPAGAAPTQRMATGKPISAPRPTPAAAAEVEVATEPAAQVLKLTDELRAELMSDDLVRAAVEELGAQLVKVVGE